MMDMISLAWHKKYTFRLRAMIYGFFACVTTW